MARSVEASRLDEMLPSVVAAKEPAQWRRLVGRLLHAKAPLAGAIILLGMSLVALLAAQLAPDLGVVIGLTAGYFPRLGGPVMRVMDGLQAFPSILLAIAIAATVMGLNLFGDWLRDALDPRMRMQWGRQEAQGKR